MAFISLKRNIFKDSKIPHFSLRRSLKEIGRNAYVDWILILFVCTITLIVLAVFSTLLYLDISHEKKQIVTPPSSLKILNTKDLSTIISSYDEKKIESDKARKGYGGVRDPSF